MRRSLLLSLLSGGCVALALGLLYTAGNDVRADDATGRITAGLEVLYDFHETDGDKVKDVSGVKPPLDLKIENLKAVKRKPGSLEITGKNQIGSTQPAGRLAAAIGRTGELTIETWLQTAELNQDGPARIVTISKNSSERNFTLGQEKASFDARLRTTGTSTNGIPSVASPGKSLNKNLTHVVYTRDRTGKARIFIDGRQSVEKNVPGTLTSWDSNLKLGLANEFSGDRPWRGTFQLVAIYSKALRPADVARHFKLGPNAEQSQMVQNRRDPKAELFETRIAPLLANHCLECHDPATKKGALDLSQKTHAFAESDSGKVLIPGKLSKSLLWELVESDAMPAERTPLSADEKQALKQWIEQGAVWSLDTIDPAIYQHHGNEVRNFVKRLTVSEYIETVRAAVGVDIADEARKILPVDVRADGFSNTAYNLTVDLEHVNAYAKLAEIIVGKIDIEKFVSRFEKSRTLDADKWPEMIEKMGKWVLRGPLNEQEVLLYRGISTTVIGAGGEFDEAVAFILESMLQSPRFIYRIENQIGDGSVWTVNAYELASRLSYILWGGPPDEELLQLADKGEIFNLEVQEKQIARMLADPRARARSKQFISEWLNLGRLKNLQPSPKHFPNWNPALANDMRDETVRYFEEIIWNQKRPLSDLLNAQVTYLSPALAKHYGMKSKGDSLSEYDLASVPARGGLLTQGSVLTIGGDEASMVTRGLFVLNDLLRGVIKDPPPCVDTTPVPTKAGVTQRTIAEGRLKNASCTDCHIKFEPLAFGLEKFDGLGSFHEQDEHGNPLREDGEILFPGAEKSIQFKTSAELMDLLAKSDRVRQSLIWKVTQFALGRPLTADDLSQLEQIVRETEQAGGTYQSLMRAIVLSDLVQKTRTEKPLAENKP